MKKVLATTMALGLLAFAGSAMATPVTFNVDGPSDSYVNFTDISTGISIGFWTLFGDTSISATLADLDSIPDFILNDNESKEIDFFTFQVDGNGLGEFDLTANLNFDAPTLDVGSYGSGGWGTVTAPSWLGGGTYSGGIFSWNNAVQTFSLADGNTVQIALEDGFALGAGSDKIVHATITNQGGGVAPVPEPATMLLFGTGLIGLIGYSRKRAQKS